MLQNKYYWEERWAGHLISHVFDDLKYKEGELDKFMMPG